MVTGFLINEVVTWVHDVIPSRKLMGWEGHLPFELLHELKICSICKYLKERIFFSYLHFHLPTNNVKIMLTWLLFAWLKFLVLWSCWPTTIYNILCDSIVSLLNLLLPWLLLLVTEVFGALNAYSCASSNCS